MTAKYSGNLERDVLGAQFFDQISGLLERHVAVVVAMDEQHGGAPIRNACDWALLTVVCLGAKHPPVLRNFQNACSAGGVKSRFDPPDRYRAELSSCNKSSP